MKKETLMGLDGLQGIEPFADSADDVSVLLAQRAPRRRSRLTTALVVLLIFLFGVLVGVGIGRAAANLPSGGPASAGVGQD